jgi:hypothetical protein
MTENQNDKENDKENQKYKNQNSFLQYRNKQKEI